jgi:hypothetical protein
VLSDARGLVLKQEKQIIKSEPCESIWRFQELERRAKEPLELHVGGANLQLMAELVRDSTPVLTRQDGSDRISLLKPLTPLSGMPGGTFTSRYSDIIL